jgi:hypothetical protein
MDRVETQVRFAAVLGKGRRGLWVKTDDCVRLNLGAIELAPADGWRLVRRIDENMRPAMFLPGDLVVREGAREAVDAPGEIPGAALVMRPGLPGRVECIAARGDIEVGTAAWRGLRALPGDVVRTGAGATCHVLGICRGEIWVRDVDSGAESVMPTQLCYARDGFRFVSKVTDFLRRSP